MSDNRRQQRPKRATGAEEQVNPYDERVIQVDRVARVVRGGRRFRFRALVAVGDHKGRVGLGVAKGADVTSAINKAGDIAKRTMVKVDIINDTIAHEVTAHLGGARVLIMPAGPGTGIIAGGSVRTVVEVSGIKNILSKARGSGNKINISYATLDALGSLVPRAQWHKVPSAPAKKQPAKGKKK